MSAAGKRRYQSELEQDEVSPPDPIRSGASSPANALKLPDFSRDREVYRFAARSAGRQNAASISQQEIDSLLSERRQLLDKQFAKNITKAEIARLAYVRWTLDRVEDAQSGQILDELESYLVQYENILNKIEVLNQQLHDLKR